MLHEQGKALHPIAANILRAPLHLLRIGLNLSGIATQYLDIPVGVLLVLVVAFRFAGSNPALQTRISRMKQRRGAGRKR